MKAPGRKATCRACGKPRDVDGQKLLRTTEAAWFKREAAFYPRTSLLQPLADGMRRLAAEGHPDWFWACDRCLKSKRAVGANIAKQNLGMGTPFAAYVDRPFRCEDCDAKSVFTAREQQHWFETLDFLIWVYPKQCAACRAKRRRQKQANRALGEALGGLDATDPSQLDAVARLYDELGAAAKAITFRARARNRRARSK